MFVISFDPIITAHNIITICFITERDENSAFLLSRLISQHAFAAEAKDLGVVDATCPNVVTGSNCLLPNGLSSLVTKLQTECENAQVTFAMNSKVTKIELDESANYRKIYVNDKLAYTARCVIVTVPLGALQNDSIKFDPPLSEKKALAIKNLSKYSNVLSHCSY